MILITDPSLIIGFQHVRTPLFVLVSLLDSTISRYTIGYIQVSEYPGIQVSRCPLSSYLVVKMLTKTGTIVKKQGPGMLRARGWRHR